MRSAALLALLLVLTGCVDTNQPGGFATVPGMAVLGKPGVIERHRQVLLDVAAMAEGMEGARVSRGRRAGL